MFADRKFDHYDFESTPLEQDMYVVDEKYAPEWERMHLSLFDGGSYEPVGYVSYIAVRSILPNALQVSWYPNIHDRFHEVRVSIPRSAFRQCVGCSRWDWKPTVFVSAEWLEMLHAKPFSLFGLTDAIGLRAALAAQEITNDKLRSFRKALDRLAIQYPGVSFISFADSVLTKSNWTVGSANTDVRYTYRPETHLFLCKDMRAACRETLGLDCYSILTQGQNEYFDEQLLHISDSRNHVSLNSLGIPFAQLLELDKAVRSAIHNDTHSPAPLYLDSTVFHSLQLDYKFKQGTHQRFGYCSPMESSVAQYLCFDLDEISGHVQQHAGDA